MEIQEIECIPIEVPLVEVFETNFGRFRSRKVIIVKVDSSNGSGVGECPVFGPYYSYETVKTALHIIKDYISPLLANEDISSIEEYREKVSAIRGHPFTKSSIEMALWDIHAKKNSNPLFKELGGTRQKVPAQISIGVKESLDQLLQAIEEGLNKGYRQIKIKIKPGWDLGVVREVRNRYPDIQLMVDANAGYSIEESKRLKELDKFDLSMIEQPLGYDDLYFHSKLQAELETPICLDESIHSVLDTKTAIELGSCEIVNVKVARVGGLEEARKIQKLCAEAGVDAWCGGMVESGIGKAFNIATATLPGFSMPNDITPSRTYYEEDLIEPQIELDKNGFIEVPERNGLGFDVNWKMVDKYRID